MLSAECSLQASGPLRARHFRCGLESWFMSLRATGITPSHPLLKEYVLPDHSEGLRSISHSAVARSPTADHNPYNVRVLLSNALLARENLEFLLSLGSDRSVIAVGSRAREFGTGKGS
jgi:hypothetical protein